MRQIMQMHGKVDVILSVTAFCPNFPAVTREKSYREHKLAFCNTNFFPNRRKLRLQIYPARILYLERNELQETLQSLCKISISCSTHFQHFAGRTSRSHTSFASLVIIVRHAIRVNFKVFFRNRSIFVNISLVIPNVILTALRSYLSSMFPIIPLLRM